MTCFRQYGKSNREGIWAKKLLRSNLEISSLGQNWTKFELGEVYGNSVIDGGFNYEFDYVRDIQDVKQLVWFNGIEFGQAVHLKVILA